MSACEDWSRAGWRAHLPGVTDVPALVGQLGAATIPELAAASADQVPGRVAVTVDGEPVTHAELDADAGRVGFPTAVNNRPAYFSWTPGEAELEFWHFADETARRPIPKLWAKISSSP